MRRLEVTLYGSSPMVHGTCDIQFCTLFSERHFMVCIGLDMGTIMKALAEIALHFGEVQCTHLRSISF
jgi:hypothetical protein